MEIKIRKVAEFESKAVGDHEDLISGLLGGEKGEFRFVLWWLAGKFIARTTRRFCK